MRHEALEEAICLYFSEHNIDGMLAVLDPLHAHLFMYPLINIIRCYKITYYIICHLCVQVAALCQVISIKKLLYHMSIIEMLIRYSHFWDEEHFSLFKP